MDVREQLLKLSESEKKERKKIKADYYLYKGKCQDKEKAKRDPVMLGQNWDTNDNIDYIPTQDIRNKIKPLLKKQARFMFGKEPTIILKPDNLADKDSCEELRRYIDNVLESNAFWNMTKKAFLMSTIKKRVVLRVEANENQPLVILYDEIDNVSYKEHRGKITEINFYEEDEINQFTNVSSEKIYHIHSYFYNEEYKPVYRKSSYKGDDLKNPFNQEETVTGFDTIGCWVIKNGGELNDEFGESDVCDLEDGQNQYNRRISDFADALRFQMFGADSIIDGHAEDVESLTVAPNSINPIRTRDEALDKGKQAIHTRVEYNFGNAEAILKYLEKTEDDMNESIDMPKLKDMNNIPSAKAMKYMYNDLIGRCEEKWNDWEPVFKELMLFILEVSNKYKTQGFNRKWMALKYSTIFIPNYPIPSDEEDKKQVALSEITSNAKSIRSYIKEFSNEEDAEKIFNDILEEKKRLAEAENDMIQVDDTGSSDE